MRVKELNNKVAHVAWSPQVIYPTYIAAGTAAEQLDSSFSTKAHLELLKLDLTNPNTDLDVSASLETDTRFAKLIWTNSENNLIIGGGENSKIYLFDHTKILNNEKSGCVVQTLDKHVTGSVSALDINPFQKNLLASGGSSSEILIWDLNNTETPMTPGAKIQPLDDINCVAWNNQVPHILGSTCSGKCVVWDLRKNESIIKVSDNMSKMKARLVAWHPDVATQMCLSSDDDHSPFLQLWDLRFATSPVRILEGHQRGILAFNWCSLDSNLLLSSAKDNRLICWNPNSTVAGGEKLYELPTSGQWCFDLSWCARYPDLVCASSFEGQVNVYSLMGGKYNVIHQTSSKIMDSFGVDQNGGTTVGLPVEHQQQQTTQIIQQLKIAPKWMKRTCGACFGFGGKLVTFGKFTSENQAVGTETLDQTHLNKRITLSQVITDSDLVEKSTHLSNALQTGNVHEYCNYKIESASNDAQSSIWKFIQATFSANKNLTFVELLGFTNESLNEKISALLKKSNIDHDGDDDEKDKSKSINGNVSEHLHTLNLNGGTTNSLFGNENLNGEDFNEAARSFSPVNLTFKRDTENLISKLLLLGKYEIAVEMCIQEDRFTEAVLIANCFDKDLLAKTQKRFFKNHKNKFTNLLETFLNRDWKKIVSTCSLDDWKEALAGLMTYTADQELFSLCDELGSRLEMDESNLLNACICYIFSSNLDSLINCWQKLNKKLDEAASISNLGDSSASLQDLIEKIMILKCGLRDNDKNKSFEKLNSNLVKYAKLLADQGCFLNAYSYINDSNDSSLLLMKDRLFHVLDPQVVQQFRLKKPEYPFAKTVNSLTNAKSNIGQHPMTALNATSNAANRKPSYPTAIDRSVTPTTASYSGYTTTQTTAIPTPINASIQNVNKIMSVNHPMPLASIYSPQYNPAPVPVNSSLPPSSFNPNQFTPSSLPPPPTSTSMTANPANLFNPTTTQINNNPPQNQPPQIPSYMHTRPPTAWNDPPVVQPKIKPPPSSLNRENEAPPTFFQPTASQPASQPPFYQPNINQQANNIGGFSNQPQMFQPQQQQVPTFNQTQTFNPSSNFPQSSQNLKSQLPPPAPQKQPEKPAPVEKGPIPAENQVIKTVFDTLLSKCLSATAQPTIKRKLEDVQKKQEILYDKLRESSLSPGVVNGLHTMIQYIQAFDYPSSLLLHSQIVATSNFTEISGFMPGIKVLIQSCQQMNITV